MLQSGFPDDKMKSKDFLSNFDKFHIQRHSAIGQAPHSRGELEDEF